MNLSVIKTVPSEALNWRFFAAIWVSYETEALFKTGR